MLFSGFRFIKARASSNGFCSFAEGYRENCKNIGNCFQIFISVLVMYIWQLFFIVVVFSGLFCTISVFCFQFFIIPQYLFGLELFPSPSLFVCVLPEWVFYQSELGIFAKAHTSLCLPTHSAKYSTRAILFNYLCWLCFNVYIIPSLSGKTYWRI